MRQKLKGNISLQKNFLLDLLSDRKRSEEINAGFQIEDDDNNCGEKEDILSHEVDYVYSDDEQIYEEERETHERLQEGSKNKLVDLKVSELLEFKQ